MLFRSILVLFCVPERVISIFYRHNFLIIVKYKTNRHDRIKWNFFSRSQYQQISDFISMRKKKNVLKLRYISNCFLCKSRNGESERKPIQRYKNYHQVVNQVPEHLIRNQPPCSNGLFFQHVENQRSASTFCSHALDEIQH